MFLLKKGRAIYNLFVNYKTFSPEIFELSTKKLEINKTTTVKHQIMCCLNIWVL